MDHGIEFAGIRLYDAATAPAYSGGRYAPGAVEMLSTDPKTWVEPNVSGALRFCLAGVAAERAVLGTYVPDGFTEDMRVWRLGAGWLEAGDSDALAEFMGERMEEVYEEMHTWAADSADRIVALATHLSGLPIPSVMPYADVAAFDDSLGSPTT